jgi:hypothetical protein
MPTFPGVDFLEFDSVLRSLRARHATGIPEKRVADPPGME